MRPCQAIPSIVAALAFVAIGSTWHDAHAQAWVADDGSLDFSLDYNLGISDKVVDESFTAPNAGTTSHQFTLAGEYVPVSHLAVTAALPLVLLKYTGLDPKTTPGYDHPGGGRYDDGKIHTTLTDLRVGVRYQVLEEPFALSPHLAVSIPVADYETIGNAVAGRHLKTLHAGLAIGHVFYDTNYVHLLYDFGLAEKYDRAPDTKKYGQNTSDLGFTVGHKALEQRLDIHLDANFHLTHDGVSFTHFQELTTDEQNYHDAILAEDMFLLGGGIAYQISNAVAVSLSGRYFVWGKNTINASVLAAGVTWSPL